MSQENKISDAELSAAADAILAEPNGYDNFVRSLFNRSGDNSKDLAHAALGIVTELHELSEYNSRANLIEELGDLTFYGKALAIVLSDAGYQRPSAEAVAERAAGCALDEDVAAATTNTLLDITKRWVGYGRAPTPEQGAEAWVCGLALATSVMAVLDDVLVNEGVSVEDIFRANVMKLYERYQGVKFSADRAINRDVDREREVLESAAPAAGV